MEDLTSALEEHGIDGVVKPEYFAGNTNTKNSVIITMMYGWLMM
jgi:hypothetical protein